MYEAVPDIMADRHCVRRVGTFAVAALLGLLPSPPLHAGVVDSFIQEKERGWFWYEIEPEPPPEPLPPEFPPPAVIAPAPASTPETPPPLSVEWFKEYYPSVLNKAVDNPTPENVAGYRYATRVMLDKASNFAHEFKRQALLDPLLDESNRYPFSSAARGSFANFTNQQKREAVQTIAARAGLWVFVDETCPFCSMQYPIIARTAKERGFVVSYITPDGSRPEWMAEEDEVLKDEGQSRALKIQVRPATVLVVPPETLTVITQGMLSQDLLEERLLVAGDMAGLLSDKDRLNAFPMERGLLTTQDIREAGQAMEQDPKALTPKVQELIEKRY
ncbi:conjugal transfer protein TraF (plasmid) [Allochromatium tepidum]|uniref:Conjugal transfer protein TraF n=1 Tax=Allochromatium tepidum TaxID=553982 RepID=A0ABN6GFQ5_9GAMM|nr:conjugal transfer protein TraF [Allochromatium tepidum]